MDFLIRPFNTDICSCNVNTDDCTCFFDSTFCAPNTPTNPYFPKECRNNVIGRGVARRITM